MNFVLLGRPVHGISVQTLVLLHTRRMLAAGVLSHEIRPKSAE